MREAIIYIIRERKFHIWKGEAVEKERAIGLLMVLVKREVKVELKPIMAYSWQLRTHSFLLV